MSAGSVQPTWLERPFASLMLAGGAIVVGVALVPWTGPTLVLGLGAAALACAVWLARRHGGETVWVAAVALMILAGELSSVSFGGQNGRLLWADAAIAGGFGWFVLRHRGALPIPAAPFLVGMLPLLAWSALGLLFAGDLLTGFAELKEWLAALVLAAAAVVAARDAARARVLLAIVAVVGTLVALHLVYSLLHSPYPPVLAVLLKRVDLPWGRSNYIAGMLILTLPVTVGLLGYAARMRSRCVLASMLLVQLIGVVVTASKGAMLAMIVALLIAFSGRHRAARLGLGVLGAVIGVGVLLYVFGPLQEVMEYRLQASAISYSASERVDLYRLSWEEFTRHPVMGVGLNNFSVLSNRLSGEDTVPHNLELGYLVELGLPGLLLVLAWVVVIGRSAWHTRVNAQTIRDRALALGLWATFLAFLIHNQVESTIYGQQYKILLMIVAAAMWRLARGANDPPSSAEKGAERTRLRRTALQKEKPALQS